MYDPACHGVSQVAGETLLRELRRGAGISLIELAGRLEDQDIRIDAAHLQWIEAGRIALIYLTVDPRFQVVHWIPYGAATLRQCAQWAEEDGET